MHFLEWKSLNFNKNSTDVTSLGYIRKAVSIVSGKGMVPNKWQAITSNNADQDKWCQIISPPWVDTV